MKRKALRLTFATAPFLIGVVLLVSCAPAEKGKDAVTSNDAVGGTIIDAVPSDVKTLFPPAAYNALDLGIISCVFDHLADIGDDLNVLGDSGFVKQLASSWTWAPDSLSIAFSLNPKARWHDGAPVRAPDVRFTFKVYSDKRSGVRLPENVSNIDSVSIADSLTPVIWFKRRTPHQFFDATYQMYVMPAHLLDTVPMERLASHPVFRAPIGSGRFRFSNWIEKQSVEIVSDTGNYRGRARLDRFIWTISGDASSAALSVYAGNADLFERLLAEDLKDLPKYPKLRALTYTEIGYSYLAFNFRARKDVSKPHPIFSDERVRRALSMGVDRDRLARAVFDTFATPGIGPSPRELFQDPNALKPIPYDVPHARALLDSAGWTLATGQTVRSKNGVPLQFDMYVQSSSAPRKLYATYIEQQFKAIGALGTAKAVENKVLGSVLDAHDFDIVLLSWALTPGLLGMPGSWGTNGSGNDIKYGSARFDATLDSALNAFKPTVARPLWLRAMQIIIDDAPAIWLYEDKSIALLHRRIQPAVIRRDAWYAHLADWSIDPAQRIDRDRTPRGGN
ncbi:MAG: peptide ABC transporter substrate-binding protein [Gemmatimonadaceae bacterium]